VERMAYIRILNCEVHCAQYFGKQTKIQNWCTVQVHIFLFCREFNTSGTKVLSIVACVW